MSEDWKPIETVPKDGTLIDLWHKSADTRVTDVWWDSDDQCFTNCTDLKDYSHWMYGPEPPKDERR